MHCRLGRLRQPSHLHERIDGSGWSVSEISQGLQTPVNVKSLQFLRQCDPLHLNLASCASASFRYP